MGEWKYRIEPYDRWSWRITVTNGPTQWGPNGGGCFCYGSRKRAIRKAERLVRKRKAIDERRKALSVEGP